MFAAVAKQVGGDAIATRPACSQQLAVEPTFKPREPDLDGALQNVVGVQLLQVVDEKYKTPALTIVRRASPMQLEAHPVQGSGEVKFEIKSLDM